MNDILYFKTWEKINKDFYRWHNRTCGDWPKQRNYLKKRMKVEFKLEWEVDYIFTVFDQIYPEDDGRFFDWDKYQLTTLIAITSSYVKNK